MSGDEGFQIWLNDLARGDNVAARALWEQYFQRLTVFARRKLDGMPRRVADEEDIALSAIKSFVRGVERGQFPELSDPDNLCRLLLVITARKVSALRKQHFAEKRGGGRVRGESAFLNAGAEEDGAIGEVLGHAPTAEFETLMLEQCEHMLAELDDPSLRVAALCKLEGYSNEEVASCFNTTTRTVERWLRSIRRQWSSDDDTRT